MPERTQSPAPEPLRASLSDADDRIRLTHLMPPQQGIAPRIRIGQHWFNTLWAVPIGAAALLCLIALAQSLRELPSVETFIQTHPGIAQLAPSVDSGFPWWLQLQHFLNMVFMLFIMRAGLQILADHPRLYWGRDCTPGSDWFRFQVPVPKDRIWTAKNDSVTLPTWLGIPGLRHTLGLSRWWHFSVNLLWLLNGIAFYALLFSTDQWRRLVPLTWEVFPAAVSTAIQYASLNFPVDQGWTRLQWPPAAELFRHRLCRGASLSPHRPDAEPGDLQCAGLVRPAIQPSGDAVGALHLVHLVRRFHHSAWRDGICYRH